MPRPVSDDYINRHSSKLRDNMKQWSIYSHIPEFSVTRNPWKSYGQDCKFQPKHPMWELRIFQYLQEWGWSLLSLYHIWSCHLSIPFLILFVITFHRLHIISPSQRYCISYESTDTWYTIRWYQYRYIDSCWELWVYIPIPMELKPYPLL